MPTVTSRVLRHVHAHLLRLFPYLPGHSGYSKRCRALVATTRHLTAALVRQVRAYSDDVWVVDSTPVECARSRETVKRRDLAGWTESDALLGPRRRRELHFSPPMHRRGPAAL